jgi:hypothetical protein
MGRFSLSFCKKILIFLGLFSQLSQALELEKVKIPDSLNCEGQETPLHGYGLRTATVFKIKVYVLALYSQDLEARPMCFNITYLKDFNNKDVDRAWEYQFKESAEHKYPELKEHLSLLGDFFGEIKGPRSQNISLVNDTTKFYENGILKGEIKGKDFQKAFLSIWFGKNPPTKELKKGLMKGVIKKPLPGTNPKDS